jgi:hypothetical protein
MDWIDLAQDSEQWRALVCTIMNLRVPQIPGKFLSIFTVGGFSRRTQLHEVSRVSWTCAVCQGAVSNFANTLMTHT